MKKGFTLAEVLITVAIIGVVAATTLPALQTNVSKSSVGPALAKVTNTLENANKLIMVDNSARTLKSVCVDDSGTDDYYACLRTNVPGADIAVSDLTYKSYDYSTDVFTPDSGYQVNDGVTIYVTANPAADALDDVPTQYDGRYYTVYVDTNGYKKKPNAVGRDTFLFYVDLRGSIIPYGGTLYKAYTNGDSTLWEESCLPEGPTDGASCTGSVADNGWKVVY